MSNPPTAEVVRWLSEQTSPPVRYLTVRDLVRPESGEKELRRLRAAAVAWEPLQQVLALQRHNGSFAALPSARDARRTFWALYLMWRCGLDVTDKPVARAVAYLDRHHRSEGALSFTPGGSGVLPCYLGVVTAALIKMGALETELVQASLGWLVAHQRFDYRGTRAGGDEPWPFRAPEHYGCWQGVSCYHGVAGAFRAFAAVPPSKRSPQVTARLGEAIDYLEAHRLFRRSRGGQPLFRHMTTPFLVGDYRSGLLDMLHGVADADPLLAKRAWVAEAVDDMAGLTVDGKVVLTKNYGRQLMSPIPFEPLDEPSGFLTYEWLLVLERLAAAGAREPVDSG